MVLVKPAYDKHGHLLHSTEHYGCSNKPAARESHLQAGRLARGAAYGLQVALYICLCVNADNEHDEWVHATTDNKPLAG